MEMKDVFISYKNEESDEAGWVKSVLESNGVTCWMAPSCIPGGSSYAKEIPQAIRNCKVFVLVLSAKAQMSKWVSREVDLAINEGKTIMPFMLENCALKDDFNFYLTNVQRYEAYENKAAAAEKMVKEIKAMLSAKDTGADEAPAQPHVSPTPQAAPAQPQVSPKPQAAPAPTVTPVPTAQGAQKPLDFFCLISLIFGISAILILGLLVLPNLLAIVWAIVGVNHMIKSDARGKGMAVAGLVLGVIADLIGLSVWFTWIGFVIALITSIVAIVLFVLQLKKATNKAQ